MSQSPSNHAARLWVVGLMIATAAAMRLMAVPLPNFQPITAMALFGGACLAHRGMAFAVPLLAMLITDAVIGFHGSMWAVYGCFGLFVLMGQGMRTRRRPLVIAGLVLSSSLIFFLVTNFAAWLGSPFYPQTVAGLMQCYGAGLAFYTADGVWVPMFLNQVMGDVLFSTALFGGLALAEKRWPSIQDQMGSPSVA